MTTNAKPTTEQYEAYKAMFDHMNVALFGGSLPDVLLNLSRAGSSKTVAFFAPGRWHREDNHETITHEISLNPRHLKAGDARETAQSLVHEMAHLWQHVAGTPPRKGYHDRQWSAKMVEIGLQPVNAKTGQDAMSAPSMCDRVIPGGKFEAAFKALPANALLPWACVEAMPVVEIAEPIVVEGPDGEPMELEPVVAAPKNKIKYSCPGCGANVWGKPSLKLGCVDLEKHASGNPEMFEANQ